MKQSNFEKGSTPLFIILFILLLVASGVGGYYYVQYQKADKIIKNPQQLAKSNTDKIMNDLRAVYVAPNEEPTIATVVDKSKLPNSPFFSSAQNGDQIIAFPKAKTAVLFRASVGKVVNTTFLESVPEQNTAGTQEIVDELSPMPTQAAAVSITPQVVLTISPTPSVEVVAPTSATSLTPSPSN